MRTLPRSMKTFLALLLIPFLGVAADITTIQGDTYRKVDDVQAGPYELKFTHESGVATVPLASLPDDLLARYAPGDRAADGRFWYERAVAFYESLRRNGEAAKASAEQGFRQVLEHRTVIEEYGKSLSAQAAARQQVAAEREQRTAEQQQRAKAEKRATTERRAEMMEMLRQPGGAELMLRQALAEQYRQAR